MLLWILLLSGSFFIVIIRFTRHGWIYFRETFRQQKLSKKIHYRANDTNVLDFFWIKHKFRHMRVRLCLFFFVFAWMYMTYELATTEQSIGYCLPFSNYLWIAIDAMTGAKVGLNKNFNRHSTVHASFSKL